MPILDLLPYPIRLVTLPFCTFDFPHPWKNTIRHLSPIVAEFHLGMQASIIITIFPQSSTFFSPYFSTVRQL